MSIDIVAVPLHLDWWNIPPDPQYQSIEVRITVKDGQNNPIDNQIVVFSTSLGEPLEPFPPDTGDPYTGLTGFFNGENCQLSITAVTQMPDQVGGALFFPEGSLACERFVLDSTSAQITGTQADIVPEPDGSAILFRSAVAVITLP